MQRHCKEFHKDGVKNLDKRGGKWLSLLHWNICAAMMGLANRSRVTESGQSDLPKRVEPRANARPFAGRRYFFAKKQGGSSMNNSPVTIHTVTTRCSAVSCSRTASICSIVSRLRTLMLRVFGRAGTGYCFPGECDGTSQFPILPETGLPARRWNSRLPAPNNRMFPGASRAAKRLPFRVPRAVRRSGQSDLPDWGTAKLLL